MVELQDGMDEEAPGPFSFARAARLEGVLTAAGFTGVSVQSASIPMHLGGADDAARLLVKLGPVGRALKEVEDGVRVRISAAVTEAIAPFTSAEGVAIESRAWIATARA